MFEKVLNTPLSNNNNDNDITTQKMKFFIKDFFGKYDQIRRKLRA